MLKEFPATQPPGEPRRRWFSGDDLDLIVWLAPDATTITGFQLCYKRTGADYALTWTPEAGFRHDHVDDGEANPEKNQTPILVADGAVDSNTLLARFMRSSAEIDPAVREVVLEKLRLLR